MKKELRQLIVERYKWLMLGMAALLIFITVQGTLSTISSWNNQAKELNKESSRTDFYDTLKDEQNNPEGKMYLYYDEKTDSDVSTDDFEIYKKYQLTFFDSHTYLLGSQVDSALLLLTISVICGFSLFFYDNKTNFNALLFSSRFKRNELFQMKYLLIGSTFVLSLIVSRLLVMLGLFMSIPSEYLNATFFELLPSQLMLVVFLSTIFVVSSFAGLILGEWILGILTITGFVISFPLFINGIPFGFFSKDRSILFHEHFIYYFDYSDYIRTSKESFSVFALPILISLILCIVFYFWGKKLFNEVSLENNGNYLMFDHLRNPIKWLFVVYSFFVFNATRFFEALEVKITGKNPFEDYEPSLVGSIITALIIGVISYLIAQVVIYKENPFKSFKKEAKLSYK